MPYSTVIPTADTILKRLNPGQHYAAYQIAARLGVSAIEIRELLAKMVNKGQLTKGKTPSKRAIQFCIAGTYAPPAPVAQPERAMIATPRRPPPLNTLLVGYDAEIARRQALCMLVRGAR